MTLINRIIDNLQERRERILRGDINCIPFDFPRFSNSLPGIEQGKYYLISGQTKAAKTQISNYLFIYIPILYAYNNPDKAHVKIFYFPLEETPENITLRFMAYLLYVLSNFKIRIAPIDLKSTNANKIVDQNIIDLLKSEEYQKILNFFEEHVLFFNDKNPTGIYKTAIKYAQSTGVVHYKKIKIINKDSNLEEEKEIFDYYEPKDKKEYVIFYTDHVGLLEQERGFNLRETINKYSEYMMILRNKYNYIPVCVQQQSSETSNLEAYKAGKIRPTMAGLADSKYTAKDCTVMLGITNPYMFELPEYLGYDIMKLKGNFRVLEIVLNREGESNEVIGLYFDGAVNYFKELPKPNSSEMASVYSHLSNIKNPVAKTFFSFLIKRKPK